MYWIRIQYYTLKLTTVDFIVQDQQYMYFGTLLDTRSNLERKVSNLPVLAKAAGEVAGQLALRLVHDHLLRLSTEKYLNVMRLKVGKINKDVMSLQRVSRPGKSHREYFAILVYKMSFICIKKIWLNIYNERNEWGSSVVKMLDHG